MISAAERMNALGKQAQSEGAPSSIFGAAGGLAQSIDSEERRRIGFYPIICHDAPAIAMGLASCLSYLIEQFRDVRVFRCFAMIDEDGGDEITTSDYQFSSSDWELEGLADNIQVFGALQLKSDEWVLDLIVDISLLEANELDNLSFRFPSISALVNGLPHIAETIIQSFGGSTDEQVLLAYEHSDRDAAELETLLTQVFEWNLDVYLHFWGVEWAEEDILTQFGEAAELGRKSNDEFSRWCLGMMAKQILQAGMESVGEVIIPQVSVAFSNDQKSAPGVAASALGLASLGYENRAAALLEPYLRPEAQASIWSSMIAIHLAGGQMTEAIDTCQRAFENGLEHQALYWEYAQLLINAEAHDWQVEVLLLIDPDEHDEEEQISFEIAKAIKLHLETAPGNLSALQLALAYMIDVDDAELWTYFEQLVRSDMAGDFAGDIIERLIDLDDHSSAYDILRRVTDANAYAHIFLAQLALADDDTTQALDTIAACRARFAQTDDELELELQRLEISARLPAFEETFAEIKLLLGGNRQVSEGQVELLEEAVGIAPKMHDLYVVLSRCYVSWQDNDSAAEVLEDAEGRAGAHPQIDLGLARIHWTRNQRAEAIAKLNAGLAAFPGDVFLLAQMATFLIANDQLDDARQYILRAETIAPSHRAIWQLRRLVAQKMAQ